jgi:hypothetical protein
MLTAMGRKLLLPAVFGVLLVPAPAWAQPGGAKSKERAPQGLIQLAEVTITGRIQKPIAAVDVAKIRPRLMLSELEQPFIDRISKAILKDPF